MVIITATELTGNDVTIASVTLKDNNSGERK